MLMRLSPRLATCACTMLEAPSPMPTIAITAPTPMMMPSTVSAERILLRAMARSAAVSSRAMRI